MSGTNGRASHRKPAGEPAGEKGRGRGRGRGSGVGTPGRGHAKGGRGAGEDFHAVYAIPSRMAAGRTIEKQILRQVERRGFSADNMFAVRLALEEALCNAIKHGNRLDPEKKVRVVASVNPRRVEITVEDEGEGFVRRDVPDPTACENLCKCHGRGILLMEAYMNEVEYSHGGRRVRLVKTNP